MAQISRILTLILVCSNGAYLDAAFTCKEPNKGGCSDCAKAIFCAEAGGTFNPIEIACKSTEVCVEKDDIGSCKPVKDSSSSDCTCEKDDIPGYIADPFEDTKYIMCFPEAQYSLTCPSGQTFNKDSSKCEEGGTGPDGPKCEEPGFATLPGCKKYYGCYPDPSDPKKLKPSDTFECTEDDQVFDASKGKCVDKEFSCPKDATSVHSDMVECDAFYVCVDGDLLGGKQCCDDGERFDSGKLKCVAESEVPDKNCPPLGDCIDPSTIEGACPAAASATTILPSGATAAPTGPTGSADCTTDGNKPYPGDCTKYYSCSNGKGVLQTCPGKLLFDAKSGYCDRPSEVSGC